MTAMIIITMDISNIHPDIRNLFRMSNATTNSIRMVATVLISNPTTTFDILSCYYYFVNIEYFIDWK
jgi:spore maturation protein CgeB